MALSVLAVVLLPAEAWALAEAWADHGVATRTEGLSPVTAAIVYGGLAFVVGMALVLAVAFLRRRNSRPE
jgi:hypothetical protein